MEAREHSCWDTVAALWPEIEAHAESQSRKLHYHVDDLLEVAIDEACGIVDRWDPNSGVPLIRWLQHCLALSYRRKRMREFIRQERLQQYTAAESTRVDFDDAEMQAAQQAIDALPQRERRILLMRAVGASYGDIGKLFGLAAGTARLHYMAIFSKVRRELGLE